MLNYKISKNQKMFIIYHLFDTHSCPEDRGSAWINIWHSEVPEIPSEYFPGASGRSWTVASTVCVQLRRRATPLLPPPPSLPSTHCSPMRTRQAWLIAEGRGMDLSCLCVARCSLRRSCSQLSCNSTEHCSTRFHNPRGYGIDSGCRLYSHRYRGA